MNKMILLILCGFVSAIVLDSLWLFFIARDYYQAYIGFLLRSMDGIEWRYICGALGVWLVSVVGLVLFVLMPHLHDSRQEIIAHGALYGFVVYAVYQLTNYAIINNWPFLMVILDTAWGTFLYAFLSFLLSFLL